jgi:hypothetical protein
MFASVVKIRHNAWALTRMDRIQRRKIGAIAAHGHSHAAIPMSVTRIKNDLMTGQ